MGGLALNLPSLFKPSKPSCFATLKSGVMKQILSLLLCSAFCAVLTAQITFEVGPEALEFNLQTDLSDEWSEVVAHAWVVNTSNETVNLRWERVTDGSECPANWKFKICDKNQCYTTTVLSNVVVGGQPNIPVVLAPGDTSILDVHVNPVGVAGCCTVAVKLSTVENPATVIETPMYDVCISALSNTKDVSAASVRIFPNPATDFFVVSDNPYVKHITVTNLLGKRVCTFPFESGGSYDISHLPDGMYLVSMKDGKDNILKTQRLSKRSARP